MRSWLWAKRKFEVSSVGWRLQDKVLDANQKCKNMTKSRDFFKDKSNKLSSQVVAVQSDMKAVKPSMVLRNRNLRQESESFNRINITQRLRLVPPTSNFRNRHCLEMTLASVIRDEVQRFRHLALHHTHDF